jgi:hypothetical protein
VSRNVCPIGRLQFQTRRKRRIVQSLRASVEPFASNLRRICSSLPLWQMQPHGQALGTMKEDVVNGCLHATSKNGSLPKQKQATPSLSAFCLLLPLFPSSSPSYVQSFLLPPSTASFCPTFALLLLLIGPWFLWRIGRRPSWSQDRRSSFIPSLWSCVV